MTQFQAIKALLLSSDSPSCTIQSIHHHFNISKMASMFSRTAFQTLRAIPKARGITAPLGQPLARRFVATAQEQPRLRIGSVGKQLTATEYVEKKEEIKH